MQSIFLETTINADRHFQTQKRQTVINKNLEGKKVLTSKYVIGELKNNFLKNTIAFHNLLVEEDSVYDALKRLSTVLHSERQYDRVLKVYTYIAEKVGNDKEDVLDILDILIEDVMEELFVEDIDEIIDGCNCIRYFAKPYKEGKRWIIDIGCRQNPVPQCLIKKFFQDNEEQLKKIVHADDLKETKMLDKLRKMLNHQIKKYGTNCWKIGDSIICLEVPDQCRIYTTNLSDYIPLCQVLNKELYEEV